MQRNRHNCPFTFLISIWHCREVGRPFGQRWDTFARETSQHVIIRTTVYWWRNKAVCKIPSDAVHCHAQLFCKKNIHVKRYMKNNKIEKIDRHGLTKHANLEAPKPPFLPKTRPKCDNRHHLCCYNHAIGEQKHTCWRAIACILAFKSIAFEQQYRRRRWESDEQIAYQPCNQQLANIAHFHHIWRQGVSCSPTYEFWRGCCKENF